MSVARGVFVKTHPTESVRLVKLKYVDRGTFETPTLDIVFQDSGFKMVWTVDQEIKNSDNKKIWGWKRIKIKKCKSKVLHVEYVVASSGLNRDVVKGKFARNELQFGHLLFGRLNKGDPGIWCEKNFSIEFTVMLTYEDESILSNRLMIKKYKSFIQNFTRFVQNESLADVTFIVDNQQLPAHKVVLAAQSEVFARMFVDTEEKQCNRIEIDDVELKTFQSLLNYVYSAKVDGVNMSISDLLKLMAAARKYSMNSLADDCENELMDKKFCTESVAKYLADAHSVQANQFKKKLTKFIHDHEVKVVTSEHYIELIESGRVDTLLETKESPPKKKTLSSDDETNNSTSSDQTNNSTSSDESNNSTSSDE